MISSTRSSESAFRSSVKDASSFTSDSSTPSCSAMTGLSFARISSLDMVDICLPNLTSGAGCWRSLRPEKYRAKHPVDEPGRSVAAKRFGKRNRLADGALGWHSIIVQNLIDCKPQDGLVHPRHLWQRPLRRRLRDGRVELVAVRQHTINQLAGELLHTRREPALLAMAPQHGLHVVLRRVPLVQRLQRDLTRLTPNPGRHTLRHIL